MNLLLLPVSSLQTWKNWDTASADAFANLLKFTVANTPRSVGPEEKSG